MVQKEHSAVPAPCNREEFHLPAAFQSEFRYPFIPLIEKGTCVWGVSGVFCPHSLPTGWKDFIIANGNVFSTQTTCEVNVKQKFVVI